MTAQKKRSLLTAIQRKCGFNENITALYISSSSFDRAVSGLYRKPPASRDSSVDRSQGACASGGHEENCPRATLRNPGKIALQLLIESKTIEKKHQAAAG